MREQMKRLAQWTLSPSKYRQMRHGSTSRAGVEEFHLDRPGEGANSNFTTSNVSLLSKGISILPRGLAINIERKIQRDKDNQREWVIGVFLCACGASIVLLLNIILTVIAAIISYSKFNNQSASFTTLYEGSCALAKDWARWLHLLINILSTLMLVASNYCMQCLSSPSRNDIDTAHARGKWLDIGVPSLKNLRHISRKRFVLWTVLLVTSLPIHLLYNSAVFNALSTREYRVLLAADDYDFNTKVDNDSSYVDCFEQLMGRNISSFDSASSNFEYLDVYDCFDTYRVDFNTDRGTVIAITIGSLANDSLLVVGSGSEPESYMKGYMDPSSWVPQTTEYDVGNLDAKWFHAINISTPVLSAAVTSNMSYTFNSNDHLATPPSNLSDDEKFDFNRLKSFMETHPGKEDVHRLLNNADGWRNSTWAKDVTISRKEDTCSDLTYAMMGPKYLVDHCLSEKVDEKCQLLFSLPICLIVIICNGFKVISMFLTVRDDRGEILLTIGDALSSFLSRTDPTTEGNCLLSKSNVKRQWSWRSSLNTAPSQERHSALLPKRKRWMHAVSITYCVVTISLCLVIIAVAGVLLSLGITTLKSTAPASIKDLWDLGFGSASSSTTIGSVHGPFLGVILLANTPQLVVSAAYFLYNNLLTNMHLAAEYDSYAKKAKPLRVSWPKGRQRSTYYLSLPYRYSVPLLVASVLLHWLISQSLFFFAIASFDLYNTDPIAQIGRLGFSPIAIIFAMILGAVMVGAILLLGARRYKSNIPLAGSCSAAISAACHPLQGDNHALRPVMWGEVQIPRANARSLSVTKNANVPCQPKSKLDTATSEIDGDESRITQVEGSDINLLTGHHYPDDKPYAHCGFTSLEVTPPSRHRPYA